MSRNSYVPVLASVTSVIYLVVDNVAQNEHVNNQENTIVFLTTFYMCVAKCVLRYIYPMSYIIAVIPITKTYLKTKSKSVKMFI